MSDTEHPALWQAQPTNLPSIPVVTFFEEKSMGTDMTVGVSIYTGLSAG